MNGRIHVYAVMAVHRIIYELLLHSGKGNFAYQTLKISNQHSFPSTSFMKQINNALFPVPRAATVFRFLCEQVLPSTAFLHMVFYAVYIYGNGSIAIDTGFPGFF